MDRPLWQILLSLLLLGLGLQRALLAWTAGMAGLDAVAVVAGICAALAVATAVALWAGHSATIALLVALGIALAAAALLEAFAWGVRPPVTAISMVIVVALSTGALALALRHEFGRDGDVRVPTRGPR